MDKLEPVWEVLSGEVGQFQVSMWCNGGRGSGPPVKTDLTENITFQQTTNAGGKYGPCKES